MRWFLLAALAAGGPLPLIALAPPVDVVPAPAVRVPARPPYAAGPVTMPVTDAASAMAAVHADLLAMNDDEQRETTRYLTLWDRPADDRDDYIRVTDFAVNSLSSEPALKRVRPLAGTGLAVVAFDLRDYGLDPDVWEAFTKTSRYFLADAVRTETRKTVVPYTVTTVVPWPGGVWPGDNKHYPAGAFTYKKETTENRVVAEDVKQVTALVSGFWLDPKITAAVIEMSDSVMPVAPAGEFIVKCTDSTKGPFYYDFLKLGKAEADFQKLVDGDPKAGARLKADRQGTVTLSGVTQKNRRLTRVPTRNKAAGGYYWYSTDARTDTDKQNYLQILLDRGPENFDASEQIASLPNGLQAYFLVDNKGVRQDSAPDFIAGDKLTTNNDSRVRNGLSCIRCHDTGILPFRSAYKGLRRSIKIYSYKADALERLDQLYAADLDDLIEADAHSYDLAVRRLTGWPATKNARQYAARFREWDETPVTAAVAAGDCGVPLAAFQAVLRAAFDPKYDGPDRLSNATLAALIADDPEPVSRDQWTKAFPDAMTVISNAAKRAAKGK